MGVAGESPSLSTRDVVERCGSGINVSTVQYAARTGKLPGQKVSGTWRFSEEEVNAFCAGLEERKRNRSSRPMKRNSPYTRLKEPALRIVAFVNFVASLLTLLTTVWTGYLPALGVILSIFHAVTGAAVWLWSKRNTPTDADVVDGEEIDPDVIAWYRSHHGAHGDQNANEVPATLAGEVAAKGLGNVASFGVLQTVQIVMVAATVMYSGGAIAGSADDTRGNGNEEPRYFTSCEDWLSGVGATDIEERPILEVPGSRHFANCYGRIGSIEVRAGIGILEPGSEENWTDVLVEMERSALCQTSALPESGLPGCMHENEALVILEVVPTDDVRFTIHLMDYADSPASDLTAIAIEIANHFDAMSKQAP